MEALERANSGKPPQTGEGLQAADFRGFNLKNLEARVGIEPTNKGFADLCLTTWLPRRRDERRMERETGFEPATSTLARSHSTTELLPPRENLKFSTTSARPATRSWPRRPRRWRAFSCLAGGVGQSRLRPQPTRLACSVRRRSRHPAAVARESTRSFRRAAAGRRC